MELVSLRGSSAVSRASRRTCTLKPKWPLGHSFYSSPCDCDSCPELVTSVRLEVNRLPSTCAFRGFPAGIPTGKRKSEVPKVEGAAFSGTEPVDLAEI